MVQPVKDQLYTRGLVSVTLPVSNGFEGAPIRCAPTDQVQPRAVDAQLRAS